MGTSLLEGRKNNVRLVSATTNNPLVSINGLKFDKKVGGRDIISKEPLPLFCALTYREMFNRIGGFLKPYPYGYYEDEELFYRMSKHGFKQAICQNSWVKHIGSATMKELVKVKPEVKKVIFEENRKTCIEDLKKMHAR
jgi:hypothetical protein